MVKVDKEAVKKKGKGFITEFKDFVLKGNVVDMAIGVIIGTAFADIVNALTKDFINPLISSIGGAEFGGKIHLPWTPAGEAGQYLLWGDFLTAIVNFLIMAFVLFLILKVFNKIIDAGKKKLVKEEEKAPAKKSDEVVLLEEIRDLLKKQNKK
ncbi:MAG: large conductance mechanosensitive channel protein MscL [Bacilli bacterium]|nr:large conductance mechanosensitive channel protein MscL [Bacilli bacterium]